MRNDSGNSDCVIVIAIFIVIAVIIDKSGSLIESRRFLNSNINTFKLDDDFRREKIAHGLFTHY